MLFLSMLQACISETRCRKLILSGDIGWEGRCGKNQTLTHTLCQVRLDDSQ